MNKRSYQKLKRKHFRAKVLALLLALTLSAAWVPSAFAEPLASEQEVVTAGEEVRDVAVPGESSGESEDALPDQEVIDGAEGESFDETTVGEGQAADDQNADSIDPLASNYPYFVDYEQAHNKTTVTVSLPNLDKLLLLDQVDSVTIEASMSYKGRVVRTAKASKSLSELTGGSFEMDMADYGRFSVVTKFYKGSNLVLTGDTTTLAIIADSYNIAPVSASLPMSFFTISLFGPNSIRYTSDGDLVPTILLTERPNQLNWDNFPEGVHGLPYLSKAELTTQPSNVNQAAEKFYTATPALADYVAELYSLNPTAKFNLYFVDCYMGLAHSLIYANRIPADQYTMTVLSDGSYSYSQFTKVYSGGNPAQIHADLINRWNVAKDQAYQTGKVSGGYQLWECNDQLFAAVCADENAKWWIARASNLITTEDGGSFGIAARANANVVQFDIAQGLKTLSTTDVSEFKAMYNFSDAYFSVAQEAGKEVMLFLGSRVDLEGAGFVDYSRFTMAYYGDVYQYYYKGHPATPTDLFPEKQDQLNALHITDVDSSIPAELILFFYPDIYLSGYQSSTYASVPPGMAKTMFNTTKASGLTQENYKNMDLYVSPAANAAQPIKDLCSSGHTSYLVEFSDSILGTSDYTIAIWDATSYTITYYLLEDGIYTFVRTDQANFDIAGEGLYTFQSKSASGKVLDINGASAADGANVQIWSDNQSLAQTFRFTSVGGEYFTIQNVTSGKMLDVSGAGKTPGTNVVQWEANGTDAQKWKFVATDDNDGSYYVVSACNGLYLDLQWNGTADGTNVWVYTGNNTNAQKFFLNKVEANVAEGIYTFVSKVSGSSVDMVLDIASASKANGANLQIYRSNETDAQKFRLQYDFSNGCYRIISVSSGLSLDVAWGGFSSGTNVWQYASNDTKAQKWRFIDKGEAGFAIVSVTGDGCVLDVSGASAADGANVQLWNSNNTAAQRWDLEPAA